MKYYPWVDAMRILTLLSILIFASIKPVLASNNVVLKAELQGAVQRHIERNSVAEALPYLNLESGQVEQLYITEAHPQVLVANSIFVLCATLRTAEGEPREADFYLASLGDRFRVVRTEIENRPLLDAKVRAGMFRPLD